MYILKFIKIIKHILDELHSLVLMGVLSALCLCTLCVLSNSLSQKRLLDPLELKLQMIRHEPQSGCWESNPGSLEGRPFLLLAPEPSQPQIKAPKGFPTKPRPPFLGPLKALGKQPQITPHLG